MVLIICVVLKKSYEATFSAVLWTNNLCRCIDKGRRSISLVCKIANDLPNLNIKCKYISKYLVRAVSGTFPKSLPLADAYEPLRTLHIATRSPISYELFRWESVPSTFYLNCCWVVCFLTYTNIIHIKLFSHFDILWLPQRSSPSSLHYVAGK